MVWVVLFHRPGLLPAILVRRDPGLVSRQHDTHSDGRGKLYQYFSLKYAFILATFVFEIGSLVAGGSRFPI